MPESILVGVIVAAAALYTVWALTPAAARNRVALGLAHRLGGPAARGLRGRAAAWLQQLARAPVGGCGDCPANKLTPAERRNQDQRGN